MRITVVLDDALVREALALTGVRTKKALIDLALRELVRGRRRGKNLMDLAGRVAFAPGFDHKRLRAGRGGVEGAGE